MRAFFQISDINIRFIKLFLATLMVLLSTATFAQANLDRHGLLVNIESFLAHISSDRQDWIELAPNANVRENGYPISLSESRWQNVNEIVSKQTFADPSTGHVLARTGVELNSGQIAYVSTRLKIVGQEITEVEISFDDRDVVVAKNIVRLDSSLVTIVPPESRSTREELERIGRSYFQTLTDHRPILEDFDEDRCNRYHSGNKVTNNVNDAVEGAGARTCITSLQGPWGPAVEHRFPIIEPDRGIVVGITLLHFPNNGAMYVSEVFKVLDGKIILIDNLPVMLQGAETLGFPVD